MPIEHFGYLCERDMGDGWRAWVAPLTFGRYRLIIGQTGLGWYEWSYDFDDLGGAMIAFVTAELSCAGGNLEQVSFDRLEDSPPPRIN